MTDGKHRPEELQDAVIHICPMCGVVNPSGPAKSCPHLQLARFSGVDRELSSMLAQVAEARAGFNELLSALLAYVKQSVRDQKAEIEPFKTTRAGHLGKQPARHRPGKPMSLTLENPVPRSAQNTEEKRPRRSRQYMPKVDPRQLDLIAREPPKGDA